jgi:hypothetical protein
MSLEMIWVILYRKDGGYKESAYRRVQNFEGLCGNGKGIGGRDMCLEILFTVTHHPSLIIKTIYSI